ncbi:MAG TPA: glycosyltransferase family 39 protein [Polyangia bacterium]|nr:glycosyltransferase family 39 protein [Polyangia bacterium]
MTRNQRLYVELVLAAALAIAGVSARVVLVRRNWVCAGSDSYGYLKIADEWRNHGRFAFGPEPQALEWYRRPLYPLFLVAAQGRAATHLNDGPGWKRIELWQIALELLLLWPLVYASVRRLAGPAGALGALALATLFPPAAVLPLAVLTESLAMLLAAVAVAPLLWADSRRKYAPWCLAGAGAALSALLRPDGICWVAAVVPLVLWLKIDRRERLRGLFAYALVFGVIFLPWPIRNVVRFQRAHLADGMIDRFGADVPNYRGFWDWMRSWSYDERAAGFPASCFYDSLCDATVGLYARAGAFEAPATTSDAERATVEGLLAERTHEGVTAAGSEAFAMLARARRDAHPFRVLVELPIRRAIRAWWASPNELVQNHMAWPSALDGTIPHFRACARALFVATLAAIAILLLVARYRLAALVLAVPLVVRSAALGWTGFSLPRYVAPGYPLCFILIGIAIVVAATRLPELLRRPRR